MEDGLKTNIIPQRYPIKRHGYPKPLGGMPLKQKKRKTLSNKKKKMDVKTWNAHAIHLMPKSCKP